MLSERPVSVDAPDTLEEIIELCEVGWVVKRSQPHGAPEFSCTSADATRPKLVTMHRVGLVLGGGGVTGAAYQLGALMAIQLATGWNPNGAEAVVGTSAGASVAAVVRSRSLSVDAIVQPHETREHVAERIRRTIYQRGGTRKVGRWLRHGVAAGLRSPGLTFALGSPAPYDPNGVAAWVRGQIGDDAAAGWPSKPTAIVAVDVASKQRVAFGTVGAPEVSLADAVAASSAIPLVFNPHEIDGRPYVDGGVISGTHADLLLGHPNQLDLILILAPMTLEDGRRGGIVIERVFDGVGRRALNEELALIRAAWPETKILQLHPPEGALASMRPNPMDAAAAVPSFIRTLTGFRHLLARSDVWPVLQQHLVAPSRR